MHPSIVHAPSHDPEKVLSFTKLWESRDKSCDGSLRGELKNRSLVPTSALVVSVGDSSDPIVMWASHLELTERGVPPCLRKTNFSSPQTIYFDWLADMYWLGKKHPYHVPSWSTYASIFKLATADARGVDAWHSRARWLYSDRLLPHHYAKRLGLTDKQHWELNVLFSGDVRKRRKRFRDDEEKTQARLFSYLASHPDRSGLRGPSEVFDNRWIIHRCHHLAGGNVVLTGRYVEFLTGKNLSRAVIRARIKTISSALD